MNPLISFFLSCTSFMYYTYWTHNIYSIITYTQTYKVIRSVKPDCYSLLQLHTFIVFFFGACIWMYWFAMNLCMDSLFRNERETFVLVLKDNPHCYISLYVFIPITLIQMIYSLSTCFGMIEKRSSKDTDTFDYIEYKYGYDKEKLKAELAKYNIKRFPVDHFESVLTYQDLNTPGLSKSTLVERYTKKMLERFDIVISRKNDGTYQFCKRQLYELQCSSNPPYIKILHFYTK